MYTLVMLKTYLIVFFLSNIQLQTSSITKSFQKTAYEIERLKDFSEINGIFEIFRALFETFLGLVGFFQVINPPKLFLVFRRCECEWSLRNDTHFLKLKGWKRFLKTVETFFK